MCRLLNVPPQLVCFLLFLFLRVYLVFRHYSTSVSICQFSYSFFFTTSELEFILCLCTYSCKERGWSSVSRNLIQSSYLTPHNSYPVPSLQLSMDLKRSYCTRSTVTLTGTVHPQSCAGETEMEGFRVKYLHKKLFSSRLSIKSLSWI